MISIKAKRVLFELTKDGVLVFDTCPEKLDTQALNLIEKNTGVQKEELADIYIECFEDSYVTTHDGKLEQENLTGENSKLFKLNMEKIFNDKLFVELQGYDELDLWYKQNKNNINNFANITSFVISLDKDDFKDESKQIMDESNKIHSIMDAKGNKNARLMIMGVHINNIKNIIMRLPKEYHYGLEYFNVKNYFQIATDIHSDLFTDIGRNDICPCGSGKKAKKCCLK